VAPLAITGGVVVIGQVGVIKTLEQLQGAEEVWRVSRRALRDRRRVREVWGRG
jgi:hypothetical protein